MDLILPRGPRACILLAVYLLHQMDALVHVVFVITIQGIAAPLLLRLAMIAIMLFVLFTVPADMCDCFTIFRFVSSDGPFFCGGA